MYKLIESINKVTNPIIITNHKKISVINSQTPSPFKECDDHVMFVYLIW